MQKKNIELLTESKEVCGGALQHRLELIMGFGYNTVTIEIDLGHA